MKLLTEGHICAEGKCRAATPGRFRTHRPTFVRQDTMLRKIASVVERLYEGDELFP